MDDEPSVLITYQLILEQHGFEVVAASTTEAALAAIAERPLQLVVCDLQLETQRGGFDVIDFARQRDPHVPAVLLTGYAAAEAVQEATRKSITLVFKPVDIMEFLELLDSLVGRSP